jgi:hypothetical protein
MMSGFALVACNISGQPCGLFNTNACTNTGAAQRQPNPPCCMAPAAPFSCTETIGLGAMGECPTKRGICALNDGDAISQIEITAHNNNLTLTQPVVCVPSYCDPRGQPADRPPPRHPLDTDAGPIEVEDLDGGSSCESLMADAGICAANADACNMDGNCCSGICSESNVCEACRGVLEGCTTDAECCSGICSLNACA